MEQQITHEHFYRITTDYCEEYLIPESVCSSNQVPDNPESFDEYCETGTPIEIDCVFGYFARMSAPGYTDCTEWIGPFDTEDEAKQHLDDYYGD